MKMLLEKVQALAERAELECARARQVMALLLLLMERVPSLGVDRETMAESDSRDLK